MKNMGYICNRKQNTILFMKRHSSRFMAVAPAI